MPVNSFENFPMSWRPQKSFLTQPYYKSIADYLENDILNGNLAPNTKLPPQRELADFLDINLSTITRAFKLCETKGLITAVTGKGTFVSANASLSIPVIKDDEYIDFGMIKPFYQSNSVIKEFAKKILNGKNADRLFEFNITLGEVRHKQAAQEWLSHFNINISAENILLTSGTQNALVITLLSLFKSGDKIAVESYTYINFKNLANLLNIQLMPVETDDEGICPDMLEKQCRLADIRGIYLMPSCSNPTGKVMSLRRRSEIAKIIKKHKIILIEDDAYGFLSDSNDYPMVTLIPENTVYINGLSKSLSAGLRMAYMVFPLDLTNVLIHTADNINLKVPLLNAEIATELILSGSAYKIVEEKKELSKIRCEIFSRFFPNQKYEHNSFFKWLFLPMGCNGYDFELKAQKNKVQVLCAERFSIGTNTDSAVRVAICSPKTTEELMEGLNILKNLIEEIKFTPSDKFIV